MVLHIKNMLSSRCKTIVLQELQSLGFNGHCSELGTVSMAGNLSPKSWKRLKSQLQLAGLELMDDKKSTVSNRIKGFVGDSLGISGDFSEINVSAFLRSKMDMSYPNLAKAFAERNKLTLKQYIISERVKKVKELILNQEDNLSDISSKLHYSSTAHLCHEFKKVTGFTPKLFRNNL